jgi:AraC-like DNA-binding protein
VYLVFEGPVFDQWLAEGVLDERRPVLHVEPVGVWRRRLTEVIDRHPPGSQEAALLEVCRMQMLLADVLAAAGEHHAGHSDWLAQARALLEQGRSAQATAEALHCSYATFRKRFTELAGVSPSRYQARRVIDRACELMHTGSLTDKQIAHELGFFDAFHFSRRFKQMTGLSPRTYRSHLP